MGVTFTEEQQKVIDLRRCNTLVSAAAGSGKTAVLVERIITMLTKDVPPVDVDRLLIVTYTEAAASEMKERVSLAIENLLEQNPEHAGLQRQAALVHNAQITTIHSFCLSVIREHFHTIDLDPGFRIGEEGELKLLKHDVLEELLERYYEEGNREFLDFVECYASGRDDRKLETLILQIYEFSRSYPNAHKWLAECVAYYDVESEEELEKTVFAKEAMEYTKRCLKDLKETFILLLDVCDEIDGPHVYRETLAEDAGNLERLCGLKTFAQMQNALQKLEWSKLPSCRSKDVSKERADHVKDTRNSAKKAVAELTEQFFFKTPMALCRDMKKTKKNMQVLARLTEDFIDAFAEKKRSKNLIDFSDMEHFALQILTREENGTIVPSAVAEEYQQRYQEIMIDEYQDSNLVQETLLTSVSRVSKGIYNIFMVGDVKQSIYRFRLSRPELFMDKFNTYSLIGGEKQRIDLHKNFRSREEVLESTNYIFRQIMTEGFGGVEYDENAALYVGASYEQNPGNETEILIVDEDDIMEGNAKEWEARAVAQRIKELVAGHRIIDKKTGVLRPVTYGDIVILMRSLSGFSDVYAKVLGDRGIPTYTGSRTGYFETTEITMILNYLRVLDNPRQDIPLVAVLTFGLVGVTNTELAEVKSTTKGRSFYERICTYAETGQEKVLREKLGRFLRQLEGFRKQISYTSIHELLCHILEQTGYADYIAAMPAGEQRMANLEMLLEKAISFESTSYKGLFHFVRYIEQLQKYNVDYGEANLTEDTVNVVQMMSIHKSKGLEFPIVIVAGMGKGFNKTDATGNVLIHSDLGIGMDAIDYERRTSAPTLNKKVMQKKMILDNAAEELRILYVAMTRAKEKLILAGSVPHLKQKLANCEELKQQKEEQLGFRLLTKANNYFDWVLPAVYRNRCMSEVLEEFEMEAPFMNALYRTESFIQVKKVSLENVAGTECLEQVEEALTREILTNWDTKAVYDMGIREQLEEQMGFVYPYEQARKLNQTISVSELKKRAYLEMEDVEHVFREEEVYPLLPKFLQEKKALTGASRGSAYHRVMELLDFQRDYDEKTLEEELEWQEKQGFLSEDMRICISKSDVLAFLRSPLGKRMKEAAKKDLLHAEQPFILGMDATEIYREIQEPEVVLLQGIIDVYFEEDGELVVADYKTDKVHKAQELKDKYKMQLLCYARALERLTGKHVKEKVIYSFALQEEIEV